METEKKSDWSIADLYEQAWEILKTHKILWILGVALSTFTASSSSFNYNSSFNPTDFQKLLDTTSNPPTQEKISQVLGETTTAANQLIQSAFSSIPLSIYLLLGIEFLIVILFIIILGLISSAWAKGTLLQSIQSCIQKTKPTIRESSEKAFFAIKSLIWLAIIPNLLLIIPTIILSALIAAGLILGNTTLQILSFIALVISSGAFIYWFLMITLAEIWASRQAVLEGKSGLKAFSNGLKITQKKFWASLLLGLCNTLLGFFVNLLPLLILIPLIVIIVIAFVISPVVGVISLIIGSVFFLAFIIISMLITGMVLSFKHIVWSLAYHNIKGKYDHE